MWGCLKLYHFLEIFGLKGLYEILLIIVKISVTFFNSHFLGSFRKIWISAHYPISTKLWTLIERTNTNKRSKLRSIIKCYFGGYNPFSNFEFNVTHTRKVITVTAQKKMYPTLRVIHWIYLSVVFSIILGVILWVTICY